MFAARAGHGATGHRFVAALARPFGIVTLLMLSPGPSASSALGAPAAAAAAAEPTPLDLGTLRGGSSSRTVALNDSGQVAGDSQADGGTTHAYRWTKNRMKDLGTLGGLNGHAVAINAAGDVAGYAQTRAGEWHAVLWPAHGQAIDLGALGGASSRAAALNDKRQVVGVAERAGGGQVAFSWTLTGGMQDLGTLGGSSSGAVSVNSRGQVAGTADRSDGSTGAFVWAAATGMQDLGTLGGRSSSARAINALGQVTGSSQTDPEAPFSSVFRWSPGQTMQLLSADYIQTHAMAINDAGDVLGLGDGGYRYGTSYPIRWTAAGLTVLDHPCAIEAYPCDNEGTDISPDGTVAGFVTVPAGLYQTATLATAWSPEGQIQFLPGSGWSASKALTINGSGQIAGDAQRADGSTHAVLWKVPVSLG